MSRYKNELVDLTPITVAKNIVILPRILLCPGTQIHNTFKLKKRSSQ